MNFGYSNGFGYQQPQLQPQHYVMQNGSFYLPPINSMPAPSYMQQTYNPTYQAPMQMAAPTYMQHTYNPYMYQTQMQMAAPNYMQQTYTPTYQPQMQTYMQQTYNPPYLSPTNPSNRNLTNYNTQPVRNTNQVQQQTYQKTQTNLPGSTLNKFSPIPPIASRQSQAFSRQLSSSGSSTSYQNQSQSFNRQLGSSGSSTNYQSTSDWEKTGRVTRTKHLDGPITSDAVHSLLSELPWLTTYDRRMINQARCEVSQEWNVFLKNATVLIKLEDQDIELISGSGTNKLVVEKTDDGEMECDWQEKGIGMKLRNGVRKVGRFFTSIFSKAKHAIGSFARKAIGW